MKTLGQKGTREPREAPNLADGKERKRETKTAGSKYGRVDNGTDKRKKSSDEANGPHMGEGPHERRTHGTRTLADRARMGMVS